MCRFTTNTDPSYYEQIHLFHQDLTSEFLQSCTCFFFQENADPPFPRRRLFQEEGGGENENGHDILNSKSNVNDNEVPFLNLLSASESSGQEEKNDGGSIDVIPVSSLDPWMNDALNLSMMIQQHSKLLLEYYNLYTNQYLLLSSTSVGDINNSNNNSSMIMSNEELHHFESQIVSFMTSTTKKIELLRQNNNRNASEKRGESALISATIYHHRNGIITNLFSELKAVMNKYSKMQSIRHRNSLMILDNPYKICLYPAVGSGKGEAFTGRVGSFKEGSDSKDEHSVVRLDPLPLFNYNQEEIHHIGSTSCDEMEDFLSKYNNDSDEDLLENLNEPLPSLPTKMTLQQKVGLERKLMNDASTHLDLPMSDENELYQDIAEQISNENAINNSSEHLSEEIPLHPFNKPTMKEQQSTSAFQYDAFSENAQQEHQNQLIQETVHLTNKIQNESLESVHKVETQMIQITSLLNQFTSLINDQQVEIDVIHENALKSKDNLQKGSEQLIQAKESKRGGRHYFAWVIFLLGLALLFFNAIMP